MRLTRGLRPARHRIAVSRRGQLKLIDFKSTAVSKTWNRDDGRTSHQPLTVSDSEDSDRDWECIGALTRAKRRRQISIDVMDTNSIEVSRITFNSMVIARDTVVEFQDGTFMRVKNICIDNGTDVLIGHMFTRSESTGPSPPTARNGMI